MRLRLEESDGTKDVAVFTVPALVPNLVGNGAIRLGYDTATGALLRVDGAVRAAFDRMHRDLVLPADALAGEVRLEVERHAMPSTGLPPGDGRVWRTILKNAAREPSRGLDVRRADSPRRRWFAWPGRRSPPLPLVGHSHLDVAWLWTFAETRRKAIRTLATACRQLDADPAFTFAFSQPQLFAWLAEDEPELFERVRVHVRSGRLDVAVAPLWVECDCNLPSGESILRQIVLGARFIETAFGRTPSVAWLPDSFGFANTLPTLLQHAGISRFGTTKLGWNDTNAFPYAQFAWEGPDGSSVVAAQVASIQGEFERERVHRAGQRREPLLVGYGDGGGGAPDRVLAAAPRAGTWTTLDAWFGELSRRRVTLPVVRDELYLEEHRGTYTTHHDIKARNAALERALGEAELLGAWALALHASKFFLEEFRKQLNEAWEIVLRAQFHDVLPGSAIGAVYDDAHAMYDRAEWLVAQAARNARSVLPRTAVAAPRDTAPSRGRAGAVFENAYLRAVVRSDGTLVELRRPGGPNVVRRANRLRAYVDRPRTWEAWNVDRDYARRERRVRFLNATVLEDALEIGVQIGASLGAMRISLGSEDRFLRVDLAIDWSERHTLLRVENALALRSPRTRFGSPHGTIERRLGGRDALERARYEVPGQRYARMDAAGDAGGFALLARDTYGWSAHDGRGDARLGHSLLRGTSWPDPAADLGEHIFAYAFVPLAGDATGALEGVWSQFAQPPGVPMFVSADPALLVVATKPADDGDGVIVRVRECDGAPRRFALACGARARAVACVDARERPVDGEVALADAALHGEIGAFALRSFRVKLA